MSGKITDVFRQRKSGLERSSSDTKQQQVQPGAAPLSGAEPVDNTGVSEEERILRQFDLDTRFGPCAGMTRQERWTRAEKFGLNPPVQVKELLLQLEGSQWNNNIWEGRV